MVIPDLPGHGASAAPAGQLDADRMLAWLGELLERPARRRRCWSAGALAAPWRPASPPGTATGLAGWCWWAPSAWPRSTRPRRSGRPCSGSRQEPTEATRDGLFRQCFTDLDGLATKLGRALGGAGRLRPGPGPRPGHGRPPWAGSCPSFVLPAIPAADLDRIAVPTSLIWGRQDLQVPLAVAEAASARHGWPLQVIDQAGDDPPMEQPAAFLAALETALTAGATPGRAGR